MNKDSQNNERAYQLGTFTLTLERLFEDISLVFEGGEFSYEFFKEGVHRIPQFITHLNFISKKQAKLLKYPLAAKLEKQIALYSTFLLRELVHDINKNYSLLLEIDYVVGSQILLAVMKYIEDHKIQELQFANYHLYDSPLSAVTHLILLSKPLKEEFEDKVSLKLKGFSRPTQFMVGAFAFRWRKYFEKSLAIKSWATFLEMFYNLNNRVITRQTYDPRLPKGEILKMQHEYRTEGLVNYLKFQRILRHLGEENVKRFIFTLEKQKMGHDDILLLLKEIAGERSMKLLDIYKKSENLKIKAISLVNDPNTLKQRYLELWALKTPETSNSLKDVDKKNLSIEIAFKNLASFSGFNNVFSLFLKIEKELADDREKLAKEEFEFKKKYHYHLELKDGEAPEIQLYRYDKVIAEHKLIEHEANYKRLIKECENFHRQVERLAVIFERLMNSYHCLDQQEIEWCLENRIANQVLNKTLIMNASQEIGYYDQKKDKIISPIPPGDEYEMNYPIKILHISVLRELNRSVVHEKVFIEEEKREYFPQMFRESYEVYPDERNEVCSNRFHKTAVDREAFILCLSKLGWYTSLQDYAYKELGYNMEVRLGFANLDKEIFKDTELIIEGFSFHKRNYGELKLKKVPKIYFSEAVRDMGLGISQSIIHQENHNCGTQELKKRYLEQYIQIHGLKGVELKRDVVSIKGILAKYQVHLKNDELYLLDAYKETHSIEFIDLEQDGHENLPRTPFKSLQDKVDTFLKDDQLPRKEQKKIIKTLKS